METFIPSLKNVSCQRFKTQPRELKKIYSINDFKWITMALYCNNETINIIKRENITSCGNKESCCFGMSSKESAILKVSQYKNLVIHFKALIKKVSVFKNNSKKSFTVKVSENVLRG